MRDLELIAAMLEDLNRRVEYLESDDEGRRTDGTEFRELKKRLDDLNRVMTQRFRKSLPK
jgi:tetrahydromethanopterin S-methyltransferase subunit G